MQRLIWLPGRPGRRLARPQNGQGYPVPAQGSQGLHQLEAAAWAGRRCRAQEDILRIGKSSEEKMVAASYCQLAHEAATIFSWLDFAYFVSAHQSVLVLKALIVQDMRPGQQPLSRASLTPSGVRA